MATLLVHIRVRPGMEARFERVVAGLYRQTPRGRVGGPALRVLPRQPSRRRTTASCRSTTTTASSPTSRATTTKRPARELRELTEEMRLEWVDPLQQASPLAADRPATAASDASPWRPSTTSASTRSVRRGGADAPIGRDHAGSRR